MRQQARGCLHGYSHCPPGGLLSSPCPSPSGERPMATSRNSTLCVPWNSKGDPGRPGPLEPQEQVLRFPPMETGGRVWLRDFSGRGPWLPLQLELERGNRH